MNPPFSFSDSESLPLFLLVIQQQKRRRYLKLCEVSIFFFLIKWASDCQYYFSINSGSDSPFMPLLKSFFI